MSRYIDGDAVIKAFDKEYKDTKKLIEGGETHLDTLAEGYTECHLIVEHTPIADVVEVKHGKWVFDKEYGQECCSECGHIPYERLAFCCNCGAKMDLK